MLPYRALEHCVVKIPGKLLHIYKSHRIFISRCITSFTRISVNKKPPSFTQDNYPKILCSLTIAQILPLKDSVASPSFNVFSHSKTNQLFNFSKADTIRRYCASNASILSIAEEKSLFLRSSVIAQLCLKSSVMDRFPATPFSA